LTHLIRVWFVTFPLTLEPSFSVSVNTPPVYDATVPAFSGAGGVGALVVGAGVVVTEPNMDDPELRMASMRPRLVMVVMAAVTMMGQRGARHRQRECRHSHCCQQTSLHATFLLEPARLSTFLVDSGL